MMEGSACPLLDDLFDRMLADFGWSDRAAEAGIQAEVIQHLGEIDLWSKAGNRVTLNRFLQAVRVSAHEDKVWSARLHSQLYCCIQEDMLHGEAFRKHYERVPTTVASGGEGKATCGVLCVDPHGNRCRPSPTAIALLMHSQCSRQACCACLPLGVSSGLVRSIRRRVGPPLSSHMVSNESP